MHECQRRGRQFSSGEKSQEIGEWTKFTWSTLTSELKPAQNKYEG